MRTTNSQSITINEKYKSSIRLDSLGDDFEEFLDSLILHGTLKGTLSSISRELEGSQQRAFTITGPYGSGKSTLAGLLSGLVSKELSTKQAARRILSSGDDDILSQIDNAFPGKKGFSVVKHVCGLSNPVQAITESIVSQLNIRTETQNFKNLTDSQCLDLIRESVNSATNRADGIIILLDELGKALDFQSNNDGDLYFFQELADIAQSAKKPVVIIGFLHQAFSQYAKGKAALTQQEWAKVQGRYRDLNYNPTVDESLILVGDSIRVESNVQSQLERQYKTLINNVLSNIQDVYTNESSLLNTLPLDPIVSLLLGPISRRRFSQNERSIFGFLASRERYGFRWFLENQWDSASPSLYGPSLLFQYLETNLSHLISSSPDGKAWLEAHDALKRAEQKGTDIHSRIVTVIGLLSIFGQTYQLFATRELLLTYFSQDYDRKQIEVALDELAKWTLIIFRNRHSAYFVFQGSDLDINGLVLDEVESIKDGVSWAEVCTTPAQILASSHYHRTGTMRWSTLSFVEKSEKLVDFISYQEPISGQAFTCFTLIGESLKKSELQELTKKFPSLIIGSADSIERLKRFAIEFIAIKNIFKREEKLSHDHIARTELSNRSTESQQAIANELEQLFSNAKWFYREKSFGVQSLSKICSVVADLVYPNSPEVVNELVNRSRPSGSANSATNKLMLTMLNQDKEENLGFDEHTFPPEKGIYLSVLKSKGWHTQGEIGPQFTSDWNKELKSKHNSAFELWHSGFEFIKQANRTVTIAELYDHWMKPPFGLTFGLCRIYALALLKSLDGKVAYYDKDSTQSFIFIPELDEVIVEKLHKHAHEVGVRYFEIDTVQTQLVQQVAQAAHVGKTQKADILTLAKEIVRIVHLLPSWVKKTSGLAIGGENANLSLSKEAKALRNAALRANDPYKLILEEIPQIFGVKNSKKSNVDELASQLKRALEELKEQHTLLLEVFKKIIIRELGSDFSTELSKRCKVVSKSAHRPAVKEFSQRLEKHISDDNDITLAFVISTAMGVTERNWTDKHINIGLHEIYNLCRQFRREESFNRMSKSAATKTFGLILSEPSGATMELEGHITDVSNTAEVDTRVDAIVKNLEDIPDDTRREVLLRALSKFMYPVRDIEEATDE